MSESLPLLLLLVLGSGLLHVLKPEWVWELTQQWKTQNARQPSPEYLSATRVRGWMILILRSAADRRAHFHLAEIVPGKESVL